MVAQQYPLKTLIDALAAHSPELHRLLGEHVQDNHELLPHIFFGDVTRHFEKLWQMRSDPIASTEIRRILGLLEQGLATGDEEVENVIAASFIENLFELWNDPELEALIGPKMKSELKKMREWHVRHR
jgi:hypothetical protein